MSDMSKLSIQGITGIVGMKLPSFILLSTWLNKDWTHGESELLMMCLLMKTYMCTVWVAA